jgi:hypothetical protein
MISVKINKNVGEYKSKIAMGMNLRQIICFVIAIGIGVPLHFFLNRLGWGSDIIGFIDIGVILPVLAIGFFKPKNMYAEKYVWQRLKNEVVYPKVRKYKTQSDYDYFIKVLRAEERKEYKKSKFKNKKTNDIPM